MWYSQLELTYIIDMLWIILDPFFPLTREGLYAKRNIFSVHDEKKNVSYVI